LVGDFTGNWKDSVKAVHKGDSRYEVELRLRHGKYVFFMFLFICLRQSSFTGILLNTFYYLVIFA